MTRSDLTVKVKVELFGVPRLKAGAKSVEIALPSETVRGHVVQQLAQACPQLVGNALMEDLSGLQDGYVFNLNGLTFLQDDKIVLQPGDSLLLLSNQAGG